MVFAAARVTPKVSFSTALGLFVKREVGLKFSGSVTSDAFGFAEPFGGANMNLVGSHVIVATIEFSSGLYLKPLPNLKFMPVLYAGFGDAISGATDHYMYLGTELGFQ
jgi:hypothetical protein